MPFPSSAVPRGFAATTLAAFVLSALLAGCGGGGQSAPDGGDAAPDTDGDGGPGGSAGTAIVVDTPSGTTATETADGYCDILEAVTAAAFRRSMGDCANPSGGAHVLLATGGSYPVGKTLRLAPGTTIDVGEGGSGSATISAAPGFATEPGDPASGCLVFVAEGRPEVWLRDVTLTQDPSLTLTGACVTNGTLNLRRTRVTGFQAGGLRVTCLPSSGCDHEANPDDATSARVLGSLIDNNRSARRGAGISTEGSGAGLLVAHSSVVNNTGDNDGGGIYLGGGWGTDVIQSSTISGNTTSGVGGGLLVRYIEGLNTYVHIFSSTIANNTASGTGGGIEFQPSGLAMHDVSVFSSIVAGNYSTATLEWNINAAWNPNGIFNCDQHSFIYVAPRQPRPGVWESCVLDVRNPFLGPLTPLGGEGNLPVHPLLAGSPAIDGALDEGMPEDQRDGWIPDLDPGQPAEWTLFDPFVDGDGNGTRVRDLGAHERNDRWQTELLAVRAKGPSPLTVVTIPSGYDRGAGTSYAATGATGELVTYALPVGEAGRYDLSVGIRRDADAGKLQVAIANAPEGPWTPLGAEQDGYASPAAFVSLGPFRAQFDTPGEKLLRVSVTGKNPASAGYRLYLDFIEAKRRTNPCPVQDIAAGDHHTCVLMPGGGLRCWGSNDRGQLGGGAGGRQSPPPVDLMAEVAAVATGGTHTCALSLDGSVRCWGSNVRGQLGDGTTTSRSMPGEPVLSGVKAIAAGRLHTCALTTNGGVRCWGGNDHGQVGDGTTADRLAPPGADLVSGVKTIAAGGAHTCVLTTTGGVRCWGDNNFGQVGDGTIHNQRPTPPASDAITDITSLSTGDRHTCVVTGGGGLRCWGRSENSELGLNDYKNLSSPPTSDVLTGIKQVVASNFFTCALSTAGGVRCWGFSEQGAIGDDTEISADRPAPATVDILDGVARLAAGPGSTHVCALMTSGGVRCWGGNDHGQLGDGMRPILALTPPSLDAPGLSGTCE